MTARGFTLLEVVVALSILAGGTVLAQQAIGRAALGVRGAEVRDAAVLVARSRIAELRARARLAPGDEVGRDPSGPPWRRQVRLHRPVPATQRALWRVTVTVTPERGPALVLETLVISGRAP